MNAIVCTEYGPSDVLQITEAEEPDLRINDRSAALAELARGVQTALERV